MANVSIVGGGLAGLSAAWRLAERGFSVSLYEAGATLGGKAGAMLQGGQVEEHGYHIFPQWYLNVLQLMTELGVADTLVPAGKVAQLRRGEYPNMRVLQNLTSINKLWTNLTSGVMSVPQMLLFYYSAIDLMSQPYRQRAYLDQITLTGFMRSRVYRTEAVVGMYQELMLKGISVPAWLVSAMTTHHVMRYWFSYGSPMVSILKGNLQDLFISPIAAKLQQLGCQIHTDKKLMRVEVNGGRVTQLHFHTAQGPDIAPVENVILAIPAEKLGTVIDDGLYRAAPSLGKVHNLRVRSMAALHVHFKRKIHGIPRMHVSLLDSPHGLSFIDVSQFWSGYSNTVLNLISSEHGDLETASPALGQQVLLDELAQYVPAFSPEDIDHVYFQPHLREPLYMNDAGSWLYRLEATTELPNLFVAGDHCRSHVDLVSMEGATTTGLLAAEAVRKAVGVGNPIEILVPRTVPRWLFSVAKAALFPLAMIARLCAIFTP